MNDKEIEEQKERQKESLIYEMEDFLDDFERVIIEIKGTDIDMLNPEQMHFLNGMAYAIGSIVNTLKNYVSLFYEGDHEDIINLIDKVIKDNDEDNGNMNDKKIEEFEKFTKTSIDEVIRLAKEYKNTKIKIRSNGYIQIKPDCQGEPCCGSVNLRLKDISDNNNFYYCIGDLSEDGWVDKFLDNFHEWLEEIKKEEKSLIISEIIKDVLYGIYKEDLNKEKGGN